MDTVGKITIGVGRNLSDRGLSQDEISVLFETDIRLANDILDSLFSNWHKFPRVARHALISMAFNLGGPRLSKFKKMRQALERQDFATAASEAGNSLWAKQVPSRADEIIEMFHHAADEISSEAAAGSEARANRLSEDASATSDDGFEASKK